MIAWVDGAVEPAVTVALQAAGYTVRASATADLAGCAVAVLAGGGTTPAGDVTASVRRVVAAGVPRLVYLTTLEHDMDAPEGAVSPAGLAQAEVQVAPVDWTVLRVAPLFGAAAGGVAALSALAARLPVVPLPRDGGVRVQPLAAENLGEVVVRTLSAPLTVGGVHDVAGPECFRIGELLERAAWVADRRVAICRLPSPLAHVLARGLVRLGFSGAAWLARTGDLLPRDNQAAALLGRSPLPFTRRAGAAYRS